MLAHLSVHWEKTSRSLALLALAISSLRKGTDFACGSLETLCASYMGEQDPSMILCCLAFRFAVGLYTLYARGQRNSNIHFPGKLLVFSPMKYETSVFLVSEEHLLHI